MGFCEVCCILRKRNLNPIFWSNLTGRSLLRLAFMLEWIILIHGATVIGIFTIFETLKNYNIAADIYWVGVFHNVSFTIVAPIRIFLLYKGLKHHSNSTKYLQRYYKLVCFTFLPIALSLVYSKGGFFQESWTLKTYGSAIVFILLGVVFLCLIYGLQHHVQRLVDLPLMRQLKEYIQVEKEALKNDCTEKRLEDHKSIECFDNILEIENPHSELSSVSIELLESQIISPLDIITHGKSPIADGMFGIVHRGLLVRNGSATEIVLKTAKNPENYTTFKMLVQELKIFIHTGDHINIVKFFGVTADATLKYDLCIVNEYCSKGNLNDFLEANKHAFETTINVDTCKSTGLRYKDLLRFSLQICSGMSHLASKNVIHGDLAARNVLLTENLTVKVTDFGMSRRLYNYQFYSQLDKKQTFLPWRWMSIEAIEDLKLSEKSDVWSFGVTLWEIFTLGDLPYNDLNWIPEFPLNLRNGLRLSKPCLADSKIFEIMQDCWEIETTQRPTFKQLQYKIKIMN